jgi:hypothetical protein
MMTKEQIEKYRCNLADSIIKYMTAPVNTKYVEAVDSMIQCYMHISELEKIIDKDFDFTPEKAESWLLNMENGDGTKGPHWTLQQTNAYKPDGVSEYCWECVLNMMYSDYYATAVKHGVNKVDFYVDLAKEFLFDKDAKGPKEKVAAYYNSIVAK